MKNIFYLSILSFFLLGCGGGVSSIVSHEESVVPSTEENNITNLDIKDPYYKYQWEIHETNSLSWVQPGAHSNIEQAWETNTGNGVIIAIIDSSFDIDHEDLKDNILYTYNVSDGSSDVRYKEGDLTHGTSVYGIIGATKNSIGITGVAYNAKYILIKMDNTTQGLINAFHFAEEHGAQIINNSWGTYNMSDIMYCR